jgi:hypothetical protein
MPDAGRGRVGVSGQRIARIGCNPTSYIGHQAGHSYIVDIRTQNTEHTGTGTILYTLYSIHYTDLLEIGTRP